MNVSKVLKEDAMKYGLCVGWTDSWGKPNLEQLVDMYIKGLDFCILNNYPSNEFIKQHFGKVAENKGVYTDTKIDLLNPAIAILNGQCTGQIVLTGYVSRDIYVRHDSKVKIILRDSAKAFIRVYDKAHVTIENLSDSRCYLYKMSGGIATLSGKIKTRSYELRDGEWKIL